MSIRTLLVAVLAYGALLSDGNADPIRFSGQTGADVALIKDVLRNIQIVGKARLACENIVAVQSEVLGENFKPAGGPYPEAAYPVRYESWLVTLCENHEKFLVATWHVPQEVGTMFRVGYPFPAAKP
jgi:hypothetical protein